jgi:hypothetical protein
MTRKNSRYFGVLLILGTLILLSLSSISSHPFFEPTATPGKARAATLSLEAQAGHSDGILALGILLFIFIAVPIILRYRDLSSST